MFNEPGRRSAWSNHVLRMLRTQQNSRRRLVLCQAPHCCKPLRAHVGDNIDGENGESQVKRDWHARVRNGGTLEMSASSTSTGQ